MSEKEAKLKRNPLIYSPVCLLGSKAWQNAGDSRLLHGVVTQRRRLLWLWVQCVCSVCCSLQCCGHRHRHAGVGLPPDEGRAGRGFPRCQPAEGLRRRCQHQRPALRRESVPVTLTKRIIISWLSSNHTFHSTSLPTGETFSIWIFIPKCSLWFLCPDFITWIDWSCDHVSLEVHTDPPDYVMWRLPSDPVVSCEPPALFT